MLTTSHFAAWYCITRLVQVTNILQSNRIMGPIQLNDRIVQNRQSGEQMTH